MWEVLGLAVLFTVATMVVVFIAAMAVCCVTYVVDHWDEFSDLFQAAGVVLLVYVAWAFAIGVYKYTRTEPVKAEVEDVRAS